MAQQVGNPHSVRENVGLIPESCGVARRCSLDPMLLWLWCRPAAAVPIQRLAWELPFAAAVALKKKKKKTYVGYIPCAVPSILVDYKSRENTSGYQRGGGTWGGAK